MLNYTFCKANCQKTGKVRKLMSRDMKQPNFHNLVSNGKTMYVHKASGLNS